MMRHNKLRQAWDAGQKTVNGWLSIPSSFSAEVMAHQGWDSVTVDCQHGVIDYQAAVPMLQAICTTGAVPLVRVPWAEPGIVMRILDAGAHGVICPMINTKQECEDFISWCCYPPEGQRSFGPIRSAYSIAPDYADFANDFVLKFAMVETKKALDNLDEILSVPNLDGVYIGPADLASSLGVKPGFDPTDTTVLDAIAAILKGAKARNLYAAIHTGSPAFAKKMYGWGFDMTTVLSDARLIAMQAQATLRELKDIQGAGQPGSGY